MDVLSEKRGHGKFCVTLKILCYLKKGVYCKM